MEKKYIDIADDFSIRMKYNISPRYVNTYICIVFCLTKTIQMIKSLSILYYYYFNKNKKLHKTILIIFYTN